MTPPDEPTPDPMEGESLVNYAATVIKLQRENATLLASLATAEGALRSVCSTATKVVESFAAGDAAGLAHNIDALDLDLNVIESSAARTAREGSE